MDFILNPMTGIILSLIILLFSAILHEIAHGYVADRFGDPTARLRGRLTLNPISHIDPFMSILLPLLLILGGSPIIFGGAKPVPVDPFNLKEGRKDLALISLAGPATNILIAVAAAVLTHLLYPGLPITMINDSLGGFLLVTLMRLNLLLAIFNLLPIPPLDGSKVFSLILPPRMADAYLSLSSFGMIILFMLLIFPIGGFSIMGMIAQLLNFSTSLLGF